MATDSAAGTACRMSWAQVCARRLERHALAAPAKDATVADIVAATAGTHAQVLSAAELGVGLRLEGATRTAVRHALWSERTVLKTFGRAAPCTCCPHATCQCGQRRCPRFRRRPARSPSTCG